MAASAPTLPLSGVRVLDLSNVLAGPFRGYQPCRPGAEGVKVENPRGGDLARSLGADPDMSRRGFGLFFVAVNAGKQSIALDLKSATGKPVFPRLVAEADVVRENFRPGFRLDHDDPVPSPPPVLGADTDRRMAALGYSPAETKDLHAQGVIGR